MASPNTMLLHGNLSLLSCQGAEIYSHGAFSLLFFYWGSSAWTRNKTWNQEGDLRLTKVLAQAEKYDCNSGKWSERLVIRNPTAAATKFCSQMCRLSMKLWCEPWAALVKVGGVRAIALSTLYYGAASKLPLGRQFSARRAGRIVHDPPEKTSTPNQSISPVFSITYLRKMPQFAA